MSRNSPNSQIYVRCKRRHQTFFIFASRGDTIYHVKEQISKALSHTGSGSSSISSSIRDDDNDQEENTISPRKMRLYLPERTTTNSTSTKGRESTSATEEVTRRQRISIPDSATLSDHEISNDDVLYLVFRKECGGGGDGSDIGDDGDGDDGEEDGWEDVEITELE